MHLRRTASLLLPCALASAALGASAEPAVGGGGPYFYPGCGLVLQDCVVNASSGETIYVTDDTAADEAVQIGKSLRLLGGDGADHPKVGLIGVSDFGNVNPIDVTVGGLEVPVGVGATFNVVNGNSLTLRDLKVGTHPTGAVGVTLDAEKTASFVVEDSFIRSADSEADTLSLHAQNTSGPVTLRAVGNRITQHGNPDGSSGIDMTMEGPASLRANVFNNTIWDVARSNTGNSSGLVIDLSDSSTADVNVVGNTFERSNGNGLLFDNDLTGSGHLTLDVFDNIFAHIKGQAITLDPVPGLAFRAGYNDFFANTSQNDLAGKSAGPGNLHLDPRFVDRSTGNLRLKATSPLIDRGQVCSPGGIAKPDAAGRARLAGPSVDMGAYERGAGGPKGVIRLGGGGPDHLTGSAHDDVLCGYGGADVLSGLAGGDHVDGGPGPDLLVGGSGPDRLIGNVGKDILCAKDGVKGNDHLDGGKGNDGFRADSGDARSSVEHADPCLP